MKNFLLFTGQGYYPKGGIHDLKERFNDLEGAVDVGMTQIALVGMDDPDWWHVYDIERGEIVARSNNQGYGVDW
jgi:hypothetical protein